MGDRQRDLGRISRELLASDDTDAADDDDDDDEDDDDEGPSEAAKLKGVNLSRPWILSAFHTSFLLLVLLRFTTWQRKYTKMGVYKEKTQWRKGLAE